MAEINGASPENEIQVRVKRRECDAWKIVTRGNSQVLLVILCGVRARPFMVDFLKGTHDDPLFQVRRKGLNDLPGTDRINPDITSLPDEY